MKTILKQSARRRSGSVILMVALSLVMLCGFCAMAVDYGRSVLVKNQLQRACDAGALAGLRYLPLSAENARIAARYYAYLNGADVPLSNITVTNNSRITVVGTQNVKYFFAPVIKILNGTVPAQAVAAIQQRSNFLPPNIVPIGITPSTYERNLEGNPIALEGIRQNKTDLDYGEFVLFDLRGPNGKSPAHMQDQLQWGSTFNELTFIGGSETTLNAANISQAHKFEDGMQSRITAAAGASYNDNGTMFTNIPAGSPRLVTFIVTPETQAVNGTNNAQVVGFAPAYVETYTVNGAVMGIRVRFLPPASGGGGDWTDADVTNADNTPFRVSRLLG